MSDSEKIVSLKNARKKVKTEKSKDSVSETKQSMPEPVYCSFCGRPNTLILEDKLPSGEAQKILDIFWSKIK